MSAMEVGLFQLENLCATPTRFGFYDLRRGDAEVPVSLDKLLKRATKERPERLTSALTAVDKSAPLILLCENGSTSARAADQLEAAGFGNVYVIAGGLEGLLRELADV